MTVVVHAVILPHLCHGHGVCVAELLGSPGPIECDIRYHRHAVEGRPGVAARGCQNILGQPGAETTHRLHEGPLVQGFVFRVSCSPLRAVPLHGG